MTETRTLLDSSAWIEYFLTGQKEVKEMVESKDSLLLTSALSILEVKRKLLKEKYPVKLVQESIDFIRNNSIINDVSEEICEKAAEDCIKKGLHTADAIIYRTARQNNARIVTLDPDFKNLGEVTMLKK